MFPAEYLSSSSKSFLKEDFLGKNNDPPGAGQFQPHGFYLNKLEVVSCLISKLLLFGISKRRFFKFLLYTNKENQGPPERG
jgi:hypothetical protein